MDAIVSRPVLAAALTLLLQPTLAQLGPAEPKLPRPSWLLANTPATIDWRDDAAAIFNNLRTPAALIGSAAFSGAFALQPAETDSFARGLCVRSHMMLAVGSLCANLVTVIASTTAIDKLSTSPAASTCVRLTEFMNSGFKMEYVAARTNFILGLLQFVAMVGIRAWIEFESTRFSKVALTSIVGTFFVMISFAGQAGLFANGGLIRQYLTIIFTQARQMDVALVIALGAFTISAVLLLDGVVGISKGYRTAVASFQLPFFRKPVDWSAVGKEE